MLKFKMRPLTIPAMRFPTFFHPLSVDSSIQHVVCVLLRKTFYHLYLQTFKSRHAARRYCVLNYNINYSTNEYASLAKI